jgi:hypothetical protein
MYCIFKKSGRNYFEGFHYKEMINEPGMLANIWEDEKEI